MVTLSEAEKKELLDMSASAGLRQDMRTLREHRHSFAGPDGQVAMDRWLEFLDAYNAFINHEPRPFAPIVERDMKL